MHTSIYSCCYAIAEFAPSTRPECRFPQAMLGQWMVFGDDGAAEEVSVRAGELSLGSYGTYVCKSKHWSSDLYKTISTFSNGW